MRGLIYYEPTHASDTAGVFLALKAHKCELRSLHVAILLFFFVAPTNSTHLVKALQRRRNAFTNCVSVTGRLSATKMSCPATSNVVLFPFLDKVSRPNYAHHLVNLLL